jgi:hypothetical protein
VLVGDAGIFTHIEFSGLLKACGLLSYEWNGNPEIRNAIFTSFCAMFSNENRDKSDL